MNAQDKRWINKCLHKIWVIDNENDCQADDIQDFLWELAKRTGFQIIRRDNETNETRYWDF